MPNARDSFACCTAVESPLQIWSDPGELVTAMTSSRPSPSRSPRAALRFRVAGDRQFDARDESAAFQSSLAAHPGERDRAQEGR
jgi:hypothetical protein